MALPNININAGTPPLLWSSVHEAFEKINENFTALDLATGGTAIDLSNLFTDIIPSSTQIYQLGDQTHRWKSVHTGEWSLTPGSELNGLWAGAAQIKGIGLTVDLPAGSTVNEVDNGNRVEANEFSDTLNLLSGTAMQLLVDSSAESVTFNNTGVTSAVAGLGISVSAATGAVTVTNSGVRSLQSVAALPAGRSTGAGINISAASGDNIRITNTGVIEVQQGFGITVSTDVATGIATVSFNSGVAPTTAFTRFHIDGDLSSNDILSDNTADTFNLSQGYGITLSNNATTDTMTIAVNNRIDIIGSVFADSSTLLVDGVSGTIPASVVQGTFTGSVIGNVTGDVSGTAGTATTVTLVATNTTAATHFITFVDTATGNENIRTDSDLTYNPNTNTLTAGTFATGSLTITGSTIGTTDSSGIIVNELTTFNTDVTFENDITVAERLNVKGSRVINLEELKSVVAASTSFSDLQTRIAALV